MSTYPTPPSRYSLRGRARGAEYQRGSTIKPGPAGSTFTSPHQRAGPSSDAKQKPRRPPNKFMCYRSSVVRDMQRQNPGTSQCHFSEIIGSTWKQMTPAEQEPFRQQALQLKLAHERDLLLQSLLPPSSDTPTNNSHHKAEECESEQHGLNLEYVPTFQSRVSYYRTESGPQNANPTLQTKSSYYRVEPHVRAPFTESPACSPQEPALTFYPCLPSTLDSEFGLSTSPSVTEPSFLRSFAGLVLDNLDQKELSICNEEPLWEEAELKYFNLPAE